MVDHALWEVAFRDGHSVHVVARKVDPAIEAAIGAAARLHDNMPFDETHSREDLRSITEKMRPVHVADEEKDRDGADQDPDQDL